MRVLVAGGGYLGGEIIRLLASHKSGVAVWVRTARSASQLEKAGISSQACDVSSAEEVAVAARKLPWQPDAVVICVSSPVGGGVDSYRHTYLAGISHLVDAFPKARPVFISSTSVYGQTDGSEVQESSPAEPAAETSKVLIEAERVALDHDGIAVRLAGLYGPERSVLLRKFLEGTARIEDGGQRVINQIHRDDAASAIIHIMTQRPAPNGIFNVADNSPMTQRAFYLRLAGLLDRPLPPEGPRDPGKRRGWTSKRVSNAKMRALGWSPKFPSWFDALAAGQFAGMLASSRKST